MKRLTAILILFFWGITSFWSNFAQVLEQELEPVEINFPLQVLRKEVVQQLDREQLNFLQAEDLGQLLQRLAGVNLKSYGGLGGLKTISVKGIGGQHTALLVDGFMRSNAQSGLIDMGQIQVDQLEKISLGTAVQLDNLLPVSALLAGNVLQIESFEYKTIQDSFQARTSMRVGSFGQIDSYLATKFSPEKRKRVFMSAYGKYRQAKGNYPVRIMNGSETYQLVRNNNQLQEEFAGFNFGLIGKTAPDSLQRIPNELKVNYTYKKSEQGLPGAVILYNPTANQYLDQEKHQINLKFSHGKGPNSFLHYLTLAQDCLHYVDSSYLNAQGYYAATYLTAHAQQGLVFKHKSSKRNATYFGGVEQQYTQLDGLTSLVFSPERYQVKSVLGLEYQHKKQYFLFQLGHEAAKDRYDDLVEIRQNLTPFIQWKSTKSLALFGWCHLWMKRSFRMPSFNELYYNPYSSKKIMPEIANQLDLGSFYQTKQGKRFLFTYSFDFYLNVVQDKIVALPTKNLFVWSVQNYGLVRILGSDHVAQFAYSWSKKTKLDLRFTYSLQQALDVTDKNESTYGNQIPYTPLHSANADLLIFTPILAFGIQNTFVGSRYALGENSEANRVPAFYLLDLVVNKTLLLKNKQQLKLSISLKNCFNQSYAYVRYFIMPGRNFLCTLSYEFH